MFWPKMQIRKPTETSKSVKKPKTLEELEDEKRWGVGRDSLMDGDTTSINSFYQASHRPNSPKLSGYVSNGIVIVNQSQYKK